MSMQERYVTPSLSCLADLDRSNEFISRHIGPGVDEQKEILAALGVVDIDELIKQVVPAGILTQQSLDIGASHSEEHALDILRQIAWKNKLLRSLIGQGYYNVITPRIILRGLLENPGWYTAYTPYQAEISQGRLEALLNYQTMISDLTGMALSNASLLDEGTAAAEAMMLCKRVTKTKSNVFLVDQDCLPQTIGVLQTRAEPLGLEIVLGEPSQIIDSKDYFGIILQYPDCNGQLRDDYTEIIKQAHDNQAMVVMAADILALLLIKSPGTLGADVAVGCTQRFGISLSFGGPHAAYIATQDAFKRSLPGRLVGVSVDQQGNLAYRLALQTREQHIRREKATSNICTSQALLAMIASMYAVYHGPKGLRRIAERVHLLTSILAQGLKDQGYTIVNRNFFDTLTIATGDKTQAIHNAARAKSINLRDINDQQLGLSLDESIDPQDIELLLGIFALGEPYTMDIAQLESDAQSLDSSFMRTDAVLTHPSFNLYHTETEMMRYLRRLVNKDIALDRSMIPLGSCTMKLNAASEIIPITWGAFTRIHPLVPLDQAQGYLQIIKELEQMLCTMTGYDEVSLQPNSGAQGEFAGLLAIKNYYKSRGEEVRDVCLIPSSAHGTNPASANMCGMRVVVVACDDQGNVDVTDLRAKAQQHSNTLAAIMVTYPSTHGVFEERIQEVCEIVHEYGGQVYIDGANLNAMVGLCCPGKFGGDVSHFNLHKTFCIPHGGGGPGVGPIGVRTHLAPFIPGHTTLAKADSAVASAPWGSAGILPITWMYLRMMGAAGMAQATRVAILNANYIMEQLRPHYSILYTGTHDRVAHECIIDLRPLKKSSGVDPEDVAKRLIDFGFHAPTMSFPVPDTLMIEPTESESKAELDRFCEAMICIRKEISAIERGEMDRQDNPLKNAPHTADVVAADAWQHGYTREQAAYPVSRLRNFKYWSPVGRIDNAYGDRNLVCSCPDISEYK